jgi:hypothetical protein
MLIINAMIFIFFFVFPFILSITCTVYFIFWQNNTENRLFFFFSCLSKKKLWDLIKLIFSLNL